MEVGEKPASEATDTAVAVNSGEKTQPLKLNFAELFGDDHDEPTPEIEVVATEKRRKNREKERKLVNDDPHPANSHGGDDFSSMSDIELRSAIERQTKNLALAGKLPDKGEKLKAKLKCLEEELQRRELRQKEVANGFEKPMHSESSSNNGFSDGSMQEAPSSQCSIFATCLLKTLDNPKVEQNTSNQASSAFVREISCLNPCDKSKRKSTVKLPQGKRAKPGPSAKEFYAWKPKDQSPRNGVKNGKQAGRVSSFGSLPLLNEKTADTNNNEDSQALNTNGSIKDKAVVLVDEEAPELIEKKQKANDLPSTPNDGKIYYPSREDPESLEIFRSELKCLEPEECLTSTIMNFYIRFLQELYCSTDSSQHNFYFFNTYFYSKLQEAVAYQSDKEAFFLKFRRWWKGVNIFQKAYIFLPINEDNHWSLAIICIPDEECDSGLMILHLDSLGVHSSSSIFDNIKCLLINEWRILNKDVDLVNIPIPQRIWQRLPRRIENKYIVVPRQTNDYDCGLFVLYYMEQFIREAPKRLTRQLSTMFGKHWFKPQEASSLRGKIKKILQEEFNEEPKQDSWTWEPVCLPVNAETTKSIDRAEIS
ncbi:ubiquitin-like-specific protease 1D [Chenopodium quinoa]|uniref:ubiquitin-like-specific protease 1D n=1 Tax=Chenopodium quinoa TaxID=63459 RepID=UPI000B77BA27|nr:ubiquitin-like-specific protease 1D [Chenopodium quinoa]